VVVAGGLGECSKEGFRVSAAADGRAMRKALADSRIDLVLLDLMLPGEDGLSLCRALRAETRAWPRHVALI
jgi:two-component system OmpR family response regulator